MLKSGGKGEKSIDPEHETSLFPPSVRNENPKPVEEMRRKSKTNGMCTKVTVK